MLVMLKECVVMSLSNILSNKLRSFLTVLGILIGVSAVIALITTVSSFSGTLSSSFVSMGAGTLSVSVSVMAQTFLISTRLALRISSKSTWVGN